VVRKISGLFNTTVFWHGRFNIEANIKMTSLLS
jgi:hypothetical protein